MAHIFYCPQCGAEVANCCMGDDHEDTFTFSGECCGTSYSGFCGGGKQSELAEACSECEEAACQEAEAEDSAYTCTEGEDIAEAKECRPCSKCSDEDE